MKKALSILILLLGLIPGAIPGEQPFAPTAAHAAALVIPDRSTELKDMPAAVCTGQYLKGSGGVYICADAGGGTIAPIEINTNPYTVLAADKGKIHNVNLHSVITLPITGMVNGDTFTFIKNNPDNSGMEFKVEGDAEFVYGRFPTFLYQEPGLPESYTFKWQLLNSVWWLVAATDNAREAHSFFASDIIDVPDRRYVSDADLVNLGNLSGTNTGDQDLTGLTLEDKRLKAQRDCDAIAQGFANFYTSLGFWPVSTQYPATEGWTAMSTGGAATPPATGGGVTGWDFSNVAPLGLSDYLNADDDPTWPGVWAGPYMDVVYTDPWGNPYWVNADAFLTGGSVQVISAGPDYILQTPASSIRATGDDIASLVKIVRPTQFVPYTGANADLNLGGQSLYLEGGNVYLKDSTLGWTDPATGLERINLNSTANDILQIYGAVAGIDVSIANITEQRSVAFPNKSGTFAYTNDLGTAAAKDVPATGDASAAEVVMGSDTRLSDARTPTAHNQAATTITTGVLDPDRLATGTELQVLRRNAGNTALEFTTLAGGGDMLGSNNLSDVASAPTALSNLVGPYTGNSLKVVRVNSGETDLEYAAASAGNGYMQHVSFSSTNPADSTTLYFSHVNWALVSSATLFRVPVIKSGTITAASIFTYANTVAGSNENISVYIRVNNTTDYLIATVGSATAERIFTNTNLSISVSVGDYFTIKMVNPAWATNPTAMFGAGSIYIE